MATLENNPDTISCRHCGSPVRVGMIRCRECRGLLAEDADEFVLAPQVAALVQRTCGRCGTVLETGVDDCPSCASALLDEMMKGPKQNADSSSVSQVDAASRSNEMESAGKPVRPAAEWAPLRELESETDDSAPDAPAEPMTRKSPAKPTAQKGDPQQRRGTSPQKQAGPGKSSGSAKGRSSIEDDPPGLFDDDEPAPTTPTRPKSNRPTPAPVAAKEEPSSEPGAETSAACTALLASLATADENLRIEIATALGKLGDKAALGPLERHLVDKDVRVRRAVAAALVQLGHPKGRTLLDIAERKPAAPPPPSATPAYAPKSKPKSTGGGMSIDGDMLKKLVLGVVAIGIVGGGVWYFFLSGSGGSRPARKPKKKTTAAKKTAAVDVQPNRFSRSAASRFTAQDRHRRCERNLVADLSFDRLAVR